jgi:hypothetical protein
VAEVGAAIRRQFSYAVLHAVSRFPEDELHAALARLVASELVFERGTPPDSLYRFRQVLVRDIASDSLLHNARQQLHARIAEALETDSPEIMEGQPELLAQHYVEVGLVEKSVSCGAASRPGRSGARCAEKEIFALGDVLREMGTGIVQSSGGRAAELKNGSMPAASGPLGSPENWTSGSPKEYAGAGARQDALYRYSPCPTESSPDPPCAASCAATKGRTPFLIVAALLSTDVRASFLRAHRYRFFSLR